MFLSIFLIIAVVYCNENSILSNEIDEKINEGKNSNNSAPSLLLAQLIWRHGDRSPFGTYPTNIHGEELWANGFGGLTEIGMFQQFQLGKLLNSMYINSPTPLLSKKYNPKEIYITATDFNRTISSAMCNLAGMFENGEPGKDHPNQVQWPRGWTPIPVHITGKNDTSNPSAYCPRSTEILDEIKNGTEFSKFITDNQELFNFLSNKTGMKIGIDEVYLINDVHFIYDLYNMTQPDWFTKDIQKKVLKAAQIAEHFLSGVVGEKSNVEYIKLRGGRVLKGIIDRINMKLDCLKKSNSGKECDWISNLKYHAFSAHDSTIIAIISTLGSQQKILGGKIPSYTASIAFELWDIPGKGPAVKILYHNSVNEKYTTITHLIEGCPETEFCDLKTFQKRSEQFLPKDIEKECRAQNWVITE
ncbi:unnamed protein product [Caenorhabditis angaria]|uniref:Uncharacterized protein n=1 Tax=Caenorhabditis angaria TaxID=860376 RepID=A0A9P1N5E8_9PELO|nr:unnamed protein product [Caenorhabditis angaria]